MVSENKKEVQKKFDELYDQIQIKKETIEQMQYELGQLEKKIEQYKTGEFSSILEKVNSILNRHYFHFMADSNVFYFGYCLDAVEKYDGIEIKRNYTMVTSEYVYYQENRTDKITHDGYFDGLVPLTDEAAEDIQDEIDKTIHGKKSVKDLYNYLRMFYNDNTVNTEDYGKC